METIGILYFHQMIFCGSKIYIGRTEPAPFSINPQTMMYIFFGHWCRKCDLRLLFSSTLRRRGPGRTMFYCKVYILHTRWKINTTATPHPRRATPRCIGFWLMGRMRILCYHLYSRPNTAHISLPIPISIHLMPI